MGDLIDRDALIRDLSYAAPELFFDKDYLAHKIAIQPAVDAAPVVHGRWILPVPGDGELYCSACKCDAIPSSYALNPALARYYETAYCPHCGARMDA